MVARSFRSTTSMQDIEGIEEKDWKMTMNQVSDVVKTFFDELIKKILFFPEHGKKSSSVVKLTFSPRVYEPCNSLSEVRDHESYSSLALHVIDLYSTMCRVRTVTVVHIASLTLSSTPFGGVGFLPLVA